LMALQLKRGTDVQRIITLLLPGEPYYLTDYVSVGLSPFWIGDGVTYGGVVPTPGELSQLSDILITSPANYDFLQYSSATDQWINSDDLTVQGNANFFGPASFSEGVTLGNSSTDTVLFNASNVSIPNGVKFDTTTLVIDASNNRVGVGRATPEVALDVEGQLRVRGTNITADGDLIVNGGDITTSALAANVFATTATVNIGSSSGVVQIPSTIESTSPDTGALLVDGGVGINKHLHVGGTLAVDSITASTSIYTGSIQTDGGLGVVGAAYIGGAGNFGGAVRIDSTTAATSTITGSLQTDGGLGVVGAAYIGGILNTTGAATFSSDVTVNGNLEVKGTQTYLNTQTVLVEDPVLRIGNGDSSQSEMDMGIRFDALQGTNATQGFFGWDRSIGRFTFLKDITGGDNTMVGGVTGDAQFGTIYADALAMDEASIGELSFAAISPLRPGVGWGPRTITTTDGDLVLHGYDNGSNDQANWDAVTVKGQLNTDDLYASGNSTLGSGILDETTINGGFRVDSTTSGIPDIFVAPNGGKVGFGTVTPLSKIDVAGDIRLTGSIRGAVDIGGFTVTTTTTTANQILDSFPKATYKTVKYLIQVSGTSIGTHVMECLVMHDGTTAYITTYGEMFSSGSLTTIAAVINGTNVELQVTPTWNVTTTYKVTKTSIAA
jgi:hypothetical protein